MNTKTLLGCLALTCALGRAGALELYLAPMVYQDQEAGEAAHETPDLSADLIARLDAKALGDSVALRKLPGQPEPPQSFLDAARLCETDGCPYLLYGYLKHTSYSFYAELKLMAEENKQIVAVFVGGDDGSHYQRLVDDLSAKLEAYIRGDLGIGAPLPRQLSARNLLVLPTSLGYWTAVGGAWNKALAGLAAASVGLRYVPERPLFTLYRRPCSLAAGLDLEYQLGMNREGMEPFMLHEARLRIPAEAWAELGRGHELGIGLGPLFEFDILNQSHEYGSTGTTTSVGTGLSVELLYRYALSDRLYLGFSAITDILFYDRPLVTLSPRLTFSARLDKEGQK